MDLFVDGHQVIAPIIVDAQSNINGKRIDTNILATYFDKGNISNMLSEAVALENDNKVGFYYLNKKRAQSLLMKSGLQLPSRLNKIGSDIIICHISENVNIKIDTVLKSQQFIRWFGDWRASEKTPDKIANIPEYVATNEARKANRSNRANFTKKK